MILRRLVVKYWRSLLDDLSLSFGEGLTVVSGPNEAGKSTLMEAIHHALFERPDTTSREIQAIRPKGRGLSPRVLLEFESGGREYRVEKTFFAKREHTLLSRKEAGAWRPLFQDREAGEQLASILEQDGIASYAGTLWSFQGRPAGVLEEGVPESLKHHLSETLAGMLITEQDLELLALAGSEWQKRFTAGRHAPATGSDWQRGTAAADRISLDLAAERARERQHESLIQEARDARVESEKAALDHRSTRVAVEGLREKKKLWDEYTTLDAQAETRERSADSLATLRRQWAACIERMAETQRDIDFAVVAAGTARNTQERALLVAAEGRDRVAAAERELNSLSVLREFAQLLLVSRDLKRLSYLESEARKAPAEADMRSLRELWLRTATAHARLETASLKVQVSAEVPLSGSAARDGEAGSQLNIPAGTTSTWSATRALKIALDRVARIEVSTGAEAAASAKEEMDELLSRLAADIKRWTPEPADGFDGVRAALERTESLYEQAGVLRREMTVIEARLRSRPGTTGRENARDSDSALVEQFRSEHGPALARATLERWERLSDDDLAAKLAGIEVECRAGEQTLSEARADQGSTEQASQRSQAALSAAESRVETLVAGRNARLDELHRIHKQASSAHPALGAYGAKTWAIGEKFDPMQEQESELFRHLEQAAAEESAAALRIRRSAQAIMPQGEAVTSDQVKLVEARLAAGEDRRREADARYNLLLGKINVSADGLSERVHQLEEALERETRESESLTREAMAWDLLKSVLDEERQKMVDAVIDPLQKKVEPWLAHLTGGKHMSVELDPKGLQPIAVSDDYTSLRVDAKTREVSFGTTEQLAFVARLALATLLAGDKAQERELVVLDDPLVNSDPERQTRAWDLLLENAGPLQIVLLTCHPVPESVKQRATVVRIPG